MRVDEPLLVPISPREPIVPEPDEPMVPVEPVDPDMPLDPVEPAVPVMPLVPAEPVVPDVPPVPVAPGIPGIPDMPPEPVAPVEPDVSLVPVEPVEPDVPLVCPIAETLPARSMLASKILVVVKVFMIKITPVKLKNNSPVVHQHTQKLHDDVCWRGETLLLSTWIGRV